MVRMVDLNGVSKWKIHEIWFSDLPGLVILIVCQPWFAKPFYVYEHIYICSQNGKFQFPECSDIVSACPLWIYQKLQEQEVLQVS